MFFDAFKDKTVVVTGHTGFKGSWLSSWLVKLGAQVVGISDCIPTNPSMFEEIKLANKVVHNICDIRDPSTVCDLILDAQPDFLFHLAAQPIVSLAYSDPIRTISTNVMGTANVLEALRSLNKACSVVVITSDKCYENVEKVWSYKETDPLGGKDIYGGSKACAELIFHSYWRSFFQEHQSPVRLASARAGNAIGGGDWSKDRIVVDCVKSWSSGTPVEIRNPQATRPWQHVLEPLSGYLTLAQQLSQNRDLHGQSFNFGPKAEPSRSVLDLLVDLSQHWGFERPDLAFLRTDPPPFHEAQLLQLNCDKAMSLLNWEATLFYEECVEMTGEWYLGFYNQEDVTALTNQQLTKYEQCALVRKLAWTAKK